MNLIKEMFSGEKKVIKKTQSNWMKSFRWNKYEVCKCFYLIWKWCWCHEKAKHARVWAYLKLYKMFICKWLQAKWLHIINPKAYVKVSRNFLWMNEWIDVKCIDLPTFQPLNSIWKISSRNLLSSACIDHFK